MNYDIAIIGFGKAGKTLAAKAAGLGKKIAIIEKSPQMYGGTCINIGCIPTKKLVMLSKQAKFYDDKKAYFKEAMATKDALISALRAKNYKMLSDNANIDVIDGEASFLGEKELKIAKSSGEILKISAEKIVINTGSMDQIPKISINSNKVYTSKEILQIKELPNKLVIIGSGFIGLEFASMFANFGSDVKILVRKDEFLPNEDDDVRDSLKAALQMQGIEIMTSINPVAINGDTLTYETNEIQSNLQADAFLFATGRVANTHKLNLPVANVNVDKNANIIVNELLQTTNKDIYAVGDVKGGELFTYISLDDFRIVFSQLLGNKSRTTNNRSIHANVLFTDTPLAKIGLSQKQASKNENLKVLKINLNSIPNAKILGNETGFLKAMIDEKSGEILGATFHCEQSHELINQISLIMQLKVNAKIFKNQIFTHPSLSEAFNDLFIDA